MHALAYTIITDRISFADLLVFARALLCLILWAGDQVVHSGPYACLVFGLGTLIAVTAFLTGSPSLWPTCPRLLGRSKVIRFLKQEWPGCLLRYFSSRRENTCSQGHWANWIE